MYGRVIIPRVDTLETGRELPAMMEKSNHSYARSCHFSAPIATLPSHPLSEIGQEDHGLD
jgi:hypothetical protein